MTKDTRPHDIIGHATLIGCFLMENGRRAENLQVGDLGVPL
jgi:hypothetical protein